MSRSVVGKYILLHEIQHYPCYSTVLLHSLRLIADHGEDSDDSEDITGARKILSSDNISLSLAVTPLTELTYCTDMTRSSAVVTVTPKVQKNLVFRASSDL